MAVYFNILIPFPVFISELESIMDKNEIYLYAEKWSEKQGFYYDLIDTKSQNITFFSDKDYRRFFFSSKLIEIKNGCLVLEKESKKDRVSFYDDELYPYTVEGAGGKEDQDNIEIIKLRIISKTPDKQIAKFYNALQNNLKKMEGVEKGLWLKDYFDSKVFYYKTNKNMLSDFKNPNVKYVKQD